MASRRPQTMAKRAREQAVKERRDRKRAKKTEAAALRASRSEETDPAEAALDAGEPIGDPTEDER
jgi:hypothetical protein